MQPSQTSYKESALSSTARDQAALASLFLLSSCSKIPRVGPKLLERLQGMGIACLNDLLWHLPRDFEDRRTVISLSKITPESGRSYQLELNILKTRIIPGKTPRLIVECEDIEETTHHISLVFFKPQHHQKQQWNQNNRVRVFGEVTQFTQHGLPTLQMTHPEFQFMDEKNPAPLPAHLTPIYPSCHGLYQKQWRTWVDWLIPQLKSAPFSIDFLALTGLEQNHMPLLDALEAIHQGQHIQVSDTGEQKINRDHPAFQRLIVEELVNHQLLWSPQIPDTQSPAFSLSKDVETAVLKELPFKMTGAQVRSLEEIYTDLQSNTSMLRLLQGDVGSGKTLVAALAAAQVAQQGHQVAVLAPTEILANQHLQAFKAFLKPLNIQIQLLTGKIKPKERQQLLQSISEGECGIIIGTHALFQRDVTYANLSFIIIDEQHRFGVAQRLALLEKGIRTLSNEKVNNQIENNKRVSVPHQLMMTATPIPRTLTMSIYAHLKTSIIDELPPTRKPVVTKALGEDQRLSLYERVKAFVQTGQQVFWVCPLIQETEKTGERKSLEETYESLAAHMPNIPIGVLHGQLPEPEKAERLKEFIERKTQILLATSMVEVGVNIPNANLMIVEDAHNWGLTQLHQLRGRVGRGDQNGYMILLHKTPLQATSFERLNILRETSDGFEIAEKDLAIRGPGQVISTAQSGHYQFKVVDLTLDEAHFAIAKEISEHTSRNYPFIASLITKVHTQGQDSGVSRDFINRS